MAAGKGDASLKNQAASGIVEQGLARGDRLKAAGFFAVVIDSNLNSWNGCRSMPQVGFHPIFGHALRLDEPYLSSEQSVAVRHKLFQFSESRTRAGAARMKEHDQTALARITVPLTGFGPLRRRGARSTGSLGILRHQQASRAYHEEPDSGRDSVEFQCTRATILWPWHLVR